MKRALSLVLLWSVAALAQSSPRSAVYRIAGVVYDATSGQTLPGARVSLGSTVGASVPDRSVITGPDGSFSFDHLKADKYQMYAEAVGYPLQGFEEHEAPFLTGVVVGPGISAEHLAFRLQRGNAISGYVTDEFNDPVRDAQVMLFRRGLDNGEFTTHIVRSAQTDDQGFYKFAPILPGTFFVSVAARPWYANANLNLTPNSETIASPQVIDSMKRLNTAFPLTFYSGATDVSNATGITVRNGERANADIALHSVPAITVTMRTGDKGERNGPMPFIRFSHKVFGDFEIPVPTEQRGLPGQFEYLGLAPGHYLAHIGIPGAESDRVQDMDLTSDTTLDPDSFTAPGSCSIKGLVQMSGGVPLPRDLVVLLRNQRNSRMEVHSVDDKGTFEFADLPQGTYEVSISNSSDVYLLDMAASKAKVNGRSIALAGSSAADLAIVLGKGMAEIRGIAQRAGEGVGGTMVLLVPANPGSNRVLFRRDQSDSDGTFRLQRVVPGHYSVVSIDGGWDLEWSRPEILKPYLAKAEPIDVAAGRTYDITVQVQKK